MRGEADGPIPEDCLGFKNGLVEEFAAVRTCIKTHPIARDSLFISGRGSLRQEETEISVGDRKHLKSAIARTFASLSNLSAVT